MQREKRPIIADTPTGWLKILALVFMFIDHSGKMLFPQIPEMRLLGRIAFPLYAWCMVVGFHYTRSVPKYLLRIAAVGLISQPLYMVALNHTWDQPNIFLTLLLALLGLWGLREKRWGSHIWVPAAVLLLAVFLKVDYGWRGVLLILLLYAVQDKRAGIAAVMIPFCLFWGAESRSVAGYFGGVLQWMTTTPGIMGIAPYLLKLQTMALLGLPLILFPLKHERDLRLPFWVSYGIYPAHLVLLWGLEQAMK